MSSSRKDTVTTVTRYGDDYRVRIRAKVWLFINTVHYFGARPETTYKVALKGSEALEGGFR